MTYRYCLVAHCVENWEILAAIWRSFATAPATCVPSIHTFQMEPSV